jgi:hypothetical protein
VDIQVSPISSTEEYDGSNWTAGGNLNTAEMQAGAGTQTAALAFGGKTWSYRDRRIRRNIVGQQVESLNTS